MNESLESTINQDLFTVQQTMLDMMHLPTAVFGIDAINDSVAFINTNAEELFGISRTDVIGKWLDQVFPPDFYDALVKLMDSIRQGNQPYLEMEVTVNNLPAGTRHLRVFALNQDQYENAYFHCSVKDVTETKEAEQRLQDQYELQQIVADISRYFNMESFEKAVHNGLRDLGTYSNADRAYVFMHETRDSIDNIYEWCAEGIPPVFDDLNIIPVDLFPSWHIELQKNRAIHIKDIEELKQTNMTGYLLLKKHEVRAILVWPLFVTGELAGALTLVSIRGEMVWYTEDQTLLGVLSDIISAALERRKAEQTLVEDHYRRLIEGLPDAVFLLNADHTIYLMNPAGQRLLGQQGESEKKRSGLCWLFSEDANKQECLIEKVLKTGKSIEQEGTLLGIEGIWHQRLIPVVERKGRVDHVTLILRDITKEKQMSASLIRADKLATLGTLAAGVAHEINNPNNVITINIPIIAAVWNDVEPIVRRAMDAGELPTLADIPTDEFLEEIPLLYAGMAQSAERIKNIVSRLKDYVRERPMDRKYIKINEVVNDAINMVRSRLKKMKGVFIFEEGEGLPLIAGDYQQLEQVFVNMLLNACDAIEEIGGPVIVKSRYKKQADHVIVTVTDGGEGIRPEVLSRVGDPFYTTKLERGGTGLGVSISMRIVEDHGGELKYVSTPGRGTTAVIMLPVTPVESQHQ